MTEERSEQEKRLAWEIKMASIIAGCMGLPIVFCAPIILFGDQFLSEGAINITIIFSSAFSLFFMMGLMILGLKMSRSKEEFWSDANIPLQVLASAKIVLISTIVSVFIWAGAIYYLFGAQAINASVWRVLIPPTFALVLVIFVGRYLEKKYLGMRIKYFYSIQPLGINGAVKKVLDSLDLHYTYNNQGSKGPFERTVYHVEHSIEIEIYLGRGTIASIRPAKPEGIAKAKMIEQAMDAAVVKAPAISK